MFLSLGTKRKRSASGKTRNEATDDDSVETFPWCNLPEALQLKVLSELDGASLAVAEMVCSGWRRYIRRHSHLYRNACRCEFADCVIDDDETVRSWRTTYRQLRKAAANKELRAATERVVTLRAQHAAAQHRLEQGRCWQQTLEDQLHDCLVVQALSDVSARLPLQSAARRRRHAALHHIQATAPTTSARHASRSSKDSVTWKMQFLQAAIPRAQDAVRLREQQVARLQVSIDGADAFVQMADARSRRLAANGS